MRDAERLRERLELSLDRGQVAAVLVCALLVIAGVFTAGLMIGRRTAPAQGAPYGDLAALDARARKVDPPPAPEKRAVEPPPKAAETAVVTPQVQTATVVAPPQQRPLQVQPAAPPALTAPPRDAGAFTIQIGASQDRTEAARIEARARGAGLKPYVALANLGAKGTWYRVRVGAFRDRDAANRFQKDVERELRSAAVVMPTH